MTSPVHAAHEALLEARNKAPADRIEAREEIRITALLLIATELEFLANALTNIATRIQEVSVNVDAVIQHEVREDPDGGG